jgi:hypothetical protein
VGSKRLAARFELIKQLEGKSKYNDAALHAEKTCSSDLVFCSAFSIHHHNDFLSFE